MKWRILILYWVNWNYFAHRAIKCSTLLANICIFLMYFWRESTSQCVLQHYSLFKLSVLYSSVSYNSGPWIMFLQYMQSMCRWSVSSAFTAVQWNIKVYSSIQDSNSHRPRLCIAAEDFLLSCCFSVWVESSCISQIRANPTSVAPLFAYSEYLQGVTQWKKMCAFTVQSRNR